MDDRRFDRFAKRFATSSIGRRGILAAFVGAAVWSQARNADSAQPACAGDGGYCGMWQGCCPGTVCYVTATNPNSGTCRPGTATNGTGMVMLGPNGQPLTVPVVATATPRPTNVPRATKTPKPTKTPRARRSSDTSNWNLIAVVQCFDPNDPNNRDFVETTTIMNVGKNPLLLAAIVSVRSNARFNTNGDISNQEIIVAPDEQLIVRTNDPSNEAMTSSLELYENSNKEEARIFVQKLNGNGTPQTPSGGFMEFHAYCNGDPSTFVAETSPPPTATPLPTLTATPGTPTLPAETSKKRKKRRRKSTDDRKRRNRNQDGRKNRD